MQYAAAVGAVAGVLEFIPVVGPLVGAIAILGVAFLTVKVASRSGMPTSSQVPR